MKVDLLKPSHSKGLREIPSPPYQLDPWLSTQSLLAITTQPGAMETRYSSKRINLAGYTPVKLDTLSKNELDNIDIILTQNPSNGDLGNELWNNRGNIAEAVDDGSVFILHDRYVGDRVEKFLPGFGRTDGIYRNFSRDRDINFAYEPLKTGPGGTLNDGSLDNGTSSSHGYADVNKLPDGSISLLNTGIINNSVTFAYGYGEGAVVYSSIPMDYYLQGSGPGQLRGAGGTMNKYLANLLSLIGSGELGGVFAPDPEFTISLMLDRTRTMISSLIMVSLNRRNKQ